MRKRLLIGAWLGVAAVLLFALPVAAQTVIYNPSTVTWDHADFATAQKYTLGFFMLPVLPDGSCNAAGTPGASPATTRDVVKPATTTGIGMSASLPSYPVGCYVLKMLAVDVSGLASDYSAVSDPFGRRPAATSKPALK
jgi:hypothetical protein